YRATLDAVGLDYVIFGHIGQNHLHVNILPRNEEEYLQGKEIYKGFATQAVAFGGTISAEHGLGKLKTFLLPFLYGEAGIAEMRTTRKLFDPAGLLNQGTLF
ncbi:MAG: FAD-binding oxidoreductase, partial [Planctomycetes bacterium]|nr:FAD-binding oxidoreductase [Planctomycetota bacterium]